MSVNNLSPTDLSNQLFINQLCTGVIVLDAKLTIMDLNQAAQGLFLTSLQQIKSQSLPSTHLFDNTYIEQLQDCIHSKVSFTSRDLNIHQFGQASLVVDITATPIQETNPENSIIILEIFNTDRIKRLSRVEQIQEQRSSSHQLVRNLAHEIKNPLSGIRGAAQLLEHQFKHQHNQDHEQKQLQEFTQVIISEADRLRDLVDRLLGPQRPTSKHPHNIHQIVDKTIALLAAETNNQVKLIKDYDPSLPELLLDSNQIMQVLLNIGNNALQELQENTINQPQISFTTRIERRFTINNKCHRLVCRISICDNGRGIAPSIIDNIFFPMVTNRHHGTGLGLSIAQTIVAQHEGVIECDSQRGQTCFNIYVPFIFKIK